MGYISADLSKDRSTVFVWERVNGKRITKKYDAPYYFYVSDEDGPYEDIFGKKLTRLDYPNSRSFWDATQHNRNNGVLMWESDISPVYKILSEEYTSKEKTIPNITFLDIEVDYDPEVGFSSPENPYAPINAISLYNKHQDRMVVYAVPPEWSENIQIPDELLKLAEVYLCKDEAELLTRVLEEIADSDIISGWNSEGFDVPYLYERLKKKFGTRVADTLSFPEARVPYYEEIVDRNGTKKNALRISGRVHLDLMLIVQKFEPKERDSFALEAVAEEILKHMKKLEYEGSLAELYRKDFWYFVRYNIRDSEIMRELELKKGYMALAITMAQMDTCPLTDVMGTIKLTEMAITNFCHNTLNKIVPDCVKNHNLSDDKYGGAFVLTPLIGEHNWVSSVDVNSLYPSAMRTINVSPEVIIGQFLNKQDDFEQVKLGSPLEVTLDIDKTRERITKTGQEWKAYFIKNKWAVSGFGTVFDQNTKGIIPTLLELWFTQRVSYKKIAAAAQTKYLKLKDENPTEAQKYYDEYRLNDLLQQTFKLKLNSTYGACGNKYFRFYDVRLAESTTKTGIQVLFHMAKTIGNILLGSYEYPNDAVIYGDTDSAYFKTYAENKKEAVILATHIAKTINNSFPDFVRDAFCASTGYDNLMGVTQEIVADKAIFIDGKKSYMLHAVVKDGNEVDEIKITGLAIKKTTLPKPIRTKLISSFERYLKGVSWDEIGLDLLKYKEDLLASGKLDVLGLPKKIKKLEEYTENYKMNTKTKLPGHVIASIMWNSCLENYKDNASMKIKSGMRIRVFYLKKPIGRFKSIAVPVDIEVIPEWFTRDFTPLIDRALQITKLIDAPVKSIIKAINKQIPNRRDLLIEELFE